MKDEVAMNLNEILKLLAIAQGSFVGGVSIVVMYYYFVRVRAFSDLQLHLVSIIASYFLLTGCTMRTIFEEKYNALGDPWFFMAGGAYLLGDISLIFIWRRQMRLRKSGKIGTE